MLNKKKHAPKTIGVVIGTIAGVAAIAAGVVAVYNYFKKIKGVSCNNCELKDNCECHGKYFIECYDSADCFAEETSEFFEEDFEKTNT